MQKDNTMPKSNEEWKQALTPEQYAVLRGASTERAFTGKYVDHHEDGMYHCAACNAPLFSSEHKFDSGSGWPSFTEIVDSGAVTIHDDNSHGMQRLEVRCAQCDSHLGHVFNDGPSSSGKRYCINSVALDFDKKEK